MKRFFIFIFISLILNGCLYTRVKGPLTGKIYDLSPYGSASDIYNYYFYQTPEWANECRKYYISQHPNLSEYVKQAILQGKIFIGMHKDWVIASWGKPLRINRTVTANTVSEQWIYGDFGPYLYFENNILTSWQD